MRWLRMLWPMACTRAWAFDPLGRVPVALWAARTCSGAACLPRAAALACGLAEKAVSLFYERRLHAVTSPVWIIRCEGQIRAVAAALEAERAAQTSPYWLDDTISHVDIALTCAWRFVTDAHPGLIDPNAYAALAALTKKMEDTAVFQLISQPFIPPT